MSATTTRIVDLPDNMGGGSSSQYIPINVHPNPYVSGGGVPGATPGGGGASIVLPPPPPQSTSTPSSRGGITWNMDIPPAAASEPPQRIPSRDIRVDPTDYTHDEETKVNYIPKPSNPVDFVKVDEQQKEKEWREKEKNKYQASIVDRVVSEMQIPLFVSLLFFVFQMSFFHSFLQSKLHFLNLFQENGSLTFQGMAFKSVLFGIAYYAVMYVLQHPILAS